MNPFNFPQNRELRMDYSDAACPRTLELLRRTVFCGLNPDWTPAEVEAKADAFVAAAKCV